jgi:hypothetical protein
MDADVRATDGVLNGARMGVEASLPRVRQYDQRTRLLLEGSIVRRAQRRACCLRADQSWRSRERRVVQSRRLATFAGACSRRTSTEITPRYVEDTAVEQTCRSIDYASDAEQITTVRRRVRFAAVPCRRAGGAHDIRRFRCQRMAHRRGHHAPSRRERRGTGWQDHGMILRDSLQPHSSAKAGLRRQMLFLPIRLAGGEGRYDLAQLGAPRGKARET